MSSLRPCLRPGVRGLVFASLGIAALAPSAHAASISVNTRADEVAVDGRCSLREAIAAANDDAPSGDATGECDAGAGPDTVTLPAGHYSLTRLGTADDANATGDLDITGELVVTGAGAARTAIDGGGHDRVVQVAAGARVSLNGLTVTGGRAPDGVGGTSTSSTGGHGGAGAAGGGIFNGGDLLLRGVGIDGNRAGNGGAGGLATAVPGGVAIGGPGGDGGAGGGVFNAGTLTLDGSVIRGNAAGTGGAGGAGQGTDAPNGPSGNTTGAVGGSSSGGNGGLGGNGGGIWNANTLNAAQTTISENEAGVGGAGGAANGGDGGSGHGSGAGGQGGHAYGGTAGPSGGGGGIAGGTVTITRATVDHNRAGAGGDGGATLAGNGGSGGLGNGAGGASGVSEGGRGGQGGTGGGISAATLTASNVTFDHNVAGDGGLGGHGTGGSGGNGVGPGGGGDTALLYGGQGGNGGNAGAVAAGIAMITEGTVGDNRAGIAGAGNTYTTGRPGNFLLPTAGSTSAEKFAGTLGSPGTGGAVSALGADPVTIDGSILSANVPSTCTGPVTGVRDVVAPASGGCPGVAADPALGPLADHGGFVLTRALGPGSAALDAIAAGSPECLGVDARGVARPAGGACDAGAFEAAPPAAITGLAGAITTTSASVDGTAVANAAGATAHFEYGPTAAYGQRTVDVDVDGGATPRPVSAALPGLAAGTAYHYRLVVDADGGTGVGPDATFTTTSVDRGPGPPAVIGEFVAPTLSHVAFASARFAVVARKTSRTLGKPARGGTQLRFTLSEGATVVVTIERRLMGRAAGKACHGKPTCVRYAARGSITVAGAVGNNVVPFSGRIGTSGTALPAGSYRATLVAVNAAHARSGPVTVPFSVKRR